MRKRSKESRPRTVKERAQIAGGRREGPPEAKESTSPSDVKKLIGDKTLICEAFVEENRRGYRVKGEGSYLRLLPASVASPYVVSPTGFEPVLPA